MQTTAHLMGDFLRACLSRSTKLLRPRDAGPLLVALHFDDKIIEFLRTIQEDLMWNSGRNSHGIAGREFSADTSPDRAIALLMRPDCLRIDHRASQQQGCRT